MKKLLATLLTAAMLLSAVGCGPASSPAPSDGPSSASEAPARWTAGSYEAKAAGNSGDITVKVTLSADRIESVEVVSHGETAGISDAALERIPAGIVEAQGLGIDTVAGATLTSTAILTAVEDCMKQAGADVATLKQTGSTAAALEDEVIEADVVVVGGGMAGLNAALTAAREGAKVVLLEKMGALGGASITCGGEILAAGTELQKAQGIEDSPEALAEFWIATGEGKVDEEMLRMIASRSVDTVDWLAENGVEFGGVTYSFNDPAQNPMRNHKTSDLGGTGFILPLAEAAKKAGIEIRTETPAVSLIQEGGAVKGVVAQNAGRTVTVNAKSTILCTGGFANNEELVKEYCPAFGTFGTFLGETHQGDGLIMARDAGAEIIAPGGAIVNPMDMGPTRFSDPGGVFLSVTPEGKRYSNEAAYWFTRSATLYFDEGVNHYYGLFDSSIPYDKLDEAVEAKTAFRADSIEALAGQLGIDPAVLTATVARYNELCKTGVDTDFGKPAAGQKGSTVDLLEDVTFLNAIEKGPFYAVSFTTNGLTGTFGGPKTTLDGEVVSTTGATIPGLYAAGEVANGQLMYHQYPCSGSSIQFCATMGRQAGAAAAKFAK